MAFIDTVKPWFVTGAYPTQAQFWQQFTWLRWKDEKLEVADINGLTQILNTIATLANIKANYVDQLTLSENGIYQMDMGVIVSGIIVDSDVDFSLSIGSSEGANDIAADIQITGGKPETINLIIYAKAARSIYLTGIFATTKFIILKNSI